MNEKIFNGAIYLKDVNYLIKIENGIIKEKEDI